MKKQNAVTDAQLIITPKILILALSIPIRRTNFRMKEFKNLRILAVKLVRNEQANG